MQGNPRHDFLDSGFHSVKSGFRIPTVSQLRIPWAVIPQDSGFHKKNFPDSEIRIPLRRAIRKSTTEEKKQSISLFK